MSPSKQKKKLNDSNPRRSHTKQEKKSGIDKTTLILSIVAAILLVLVILFMNPNFVETILSGSKSTISANAVSPVIERVENDIIDKNTEEPLVNLGVPEQTVETEPEKHPIEIPDETEGSATARLFFIRVSDEGKISMKSVLRSVSANESPLTTAIKTLLEGPRPNELSNDVLSLIPEGSKLLGARIEDGVAFLDFNEQFRFNALGIEGYKSQVEQIVYTATEFSTVSKVQFLIDGQRIEYLGGEGFWVGGPLGREDF